MKHAMPPYTLALTALLLAGCEAGTQQIGAPPAPGTQTEAPPGAPRSPRAPADAPQSATSPAPGTAEVASAPEPAASALVAATPLADLGCERVSPEGLGIAGDVAYWAVQCWKTYPRPDEHLVLAAALRGGAATVVAASPARVSVATGAQVVLRYEDGHPVSVMAAGEATPFPTALPDSSDCTTTATDASNVYCLSGTEATGKQLKAWTMTGSDPTTLTGAGPRTFAVGATAHELAVSGGAVLVAELGTFLPHAGKGTPTHRRDGRILRVDVASGAETVLFDGHAPFALAARGGAIAWNDMFDPEQSTLAVPGASASELLDTTAAVYTPEWGLRDVALDVDAAGVTLWAASRDAKSDVVLGPSARVRYVVSAAEMPRFVTVDATSVYWVTSEGVFRRAK